MRVPTKRRYKDPMPCCTVYYHTMQPMNVHIEFLNYKEIKTVDHILSSSTVTT